MKHIFLRVYRLLLLTVLFLLSVLNLDAFNLNNQPFKLKVATYNTGHFNQGRLGGLQGEGKFVKAELNNWKRWIGEQNLDIIAVQEWNRYFDKDSAFVRCLI